MRNAPGTNACRAPSHISSYIRMNSLSIVSAWIPYEIERASEPVSLDVAFGLRWVGIASESTTHKWICSLNISGFRCKLTRKSDTTLARFISWSLNVEALMKSLNSFRCMRHRGPYGMKAKADSVNPTLHHTREQVRLITCGESDRLTIQPLG